MPRLTLTFDNGPTPAVTEQVLDVLAERDLRATFFVIGRELARKGGRAIAEKAKEAGHRIGNHTMTHSILFGSTDDPAVPAAEISATQELLGGLADDDRLFRPWGDGGLGPLLFSTAALDLLQRDAYTCVLWNSVPRDWEDPHGWVARALEDIRSREWTVLVLHDIVGGAMDQLAGFLDTVIADGVELVQDFPDDCVPIRRGALTASVDHLTTN
jgi:peptidoglycan-N-acetylglucosamine deacetylase